MSDRRRRIKAHLTYRHWSILRQLRWLPPYGWVTKAAALGLGYRQERFFRPGENMQQIPRNSDAADALIYGLDASNGRDVSTISWREGGRIVIHELPVIPPELFARMEDMLKAKREAFDEMLFGIMTGKPKK